MRGWHLRADGRLGGYILTTYIVRATPRGLCHTELHSAVHSHSAHEHAHGSHVLRGHTGGARGGARGGACASAASQILGSLTRVFSESELTIGREARPPDGSRDIDWAPLSRPGLAPSLRPAASCLRIARLACWPLIGSACPTRRPCTAAEPSSSTSTGSPAGSTASLESRPRPSAVPWPAPSQARAAVRSLDAHTPAAPRPSLATGRACAAIAAARSSRGATRRSGARARARRPRRLRSARPRACPAS